MSIYLGKNGVRQGPHSIEEVVEFIRTGEFMLSDLAWREGQSDWQPIHSLADVVEAVLPPLPSPPENPPPEPVLPTPILPPPLPSSSPPPLGTDQPMVPAPETAMTYFTACEAGAIRFGRDFECLSDDPNGRRDP